MVAGVQRGVGHALAHIPRLPMPQCRLLAGPAGGAAQACLAGVAFAALAAKRAREPPPRRPPRVFAADAAKQAVGAAAAHGAGLMIALLAGAAGRRKGGETVASECGWYLVAFALDTLSGAAIALAAHGAVVKAAIRSVAAGRASPAVRAVAACGEYGDPPSLARLAPQLAAWTACVVLGRAACGALVAVAFGALAVAAAGVDRILTPLGPSGELFAVMLAGPCLLNVAQILVQDAHLKARGKMGGGGRAAELSPRSSLLPASTPPSAP